MLGKDVLRFRNRLGLWQGTRGQMPAMMIFGEKQVSEEQCLTFVLSDARKGAVVCRPGWCTRDDRATAGRRAGDKSTSWILRRPAVSRLTDDGETRVTAHLLGRPTTSHNHANDVTAALARSLALTWLQRQELHCAAPHTPIVHPCPLHASANSVDFAHESSLLINTTCRKSTSKVARTKQISRTEPPKLS